MEIIRKKIFKLKPIFISPSWIIRLKSSGSTFLLNCLTHNFLFSYQYKSTLIAMSNLNKRKSSNPSYRKAKSWIDRLQTADMINHQLVQSHILKLMETTDSSPTYDVYVKLLPVLRRKHPDAKYPGIPKCTKKHINHHWGVYMKEFTLSVIAGAHMKGNGNRRDANGMFTTK